MRSPKTSSAIGNGNGHHPISPTKQQKFPQIKEEQEAEQLALMNGGGQNGHHEDSSQFNGEKNGTNGTPHENGSNEPPAVLDETPPMVAAAE